MYITTIKQLNDTIAAGKATQAAIVEPPKRAQRPATATGIRECHRFVFSNPDKKIGYATAIAPTVRHQWDKAAEIQEPTRSEVEGRTSQDIE